MKTIVKIIFWCIAVAMFAGCSGLRDDIDEIDYKLSSTFIYENRTDVPVTLEWYYDDNKQSEEIAIGKSFDHVPKGTNPIDHVLASDSIRLVFGGTKELWFFDKWKTDERGAIYQMDNYEETWSSIYRVDHRFIIDKTLYDRAVEIEK